MIVNIDDIKIKKRIRKDMGDLESLKESLRLYGLLNPITINERYELVAGHRRLEAARSLGWSNISAQVVSVSDKLTLLEMELEENTQRLDFTQEELIAGYTELEKLKNPSLARRLLDWIKNFFTGINEASDERRREKELSAKRLLWLAPLGIFLIFAGAFFFKKNYISTVVHVFTDIIAVVLIIIGLLNTVRFFILKK
ncbi:MAG: ParB N-terminal domain-containing protein [Treponema sp.]|jgi:ParB family chromosome partitioning protein|nr:ParB N-terminal domain-containing protein [Treponema sp.]